MECDGNHLQSSPTLVGASCDWVCVPNNEPEAPVRWPKLGDSLRKKALKHQPVSRDCFFGWKKYLWYCWNLPHVGHVDLLQKKDSN